jgi:hypothetical protein
VLAEVAGAMEQGTLAAIQTTLAGAVESYRPARRAPDGGEPRDAAA